MLSEEKKILYSTSKKCEAREAEQTVLTEVRAIMDTDWAANIDRVIRRNLNPHRKRAEFRAGLTAEGLHFSEEIADVLFNQ